MSGGVDLCKPHDVVSVMQFDVPMSRLPAPMWGRAIVAGNMPTVGLNVSTLPMWDVPLWECCNVQVVSVMSAASIVQAGCKTCLGRLLPMLIACVKCFSHKALCLFTI